MNDNFDLKNPEHRNLAAKLRNSVVDLNFYAWQFLNLIGLPSTPRTGLSDAIEIVATAVRYGKPPPSLWPDELDLIINQYIQIKNCKPENANALFYETWRFVHDFDYLFRK